MKDYILITGGHHSSAIPLIKSLLLKGINIKFVGHKYASTKNSFESSEFKEISAMGVEYINLVTPKFYNIKGIYKYLKLIKSIIYCLYFLTKNRPICVVSYGGYLAIPVVIAAKILFIKSVTHEQTLTVGLANKVIGKLVNKVLVSWKENINKNNPKYVFVGLPLREEIKKVEKKVMSKKYPLKVIFIQGGKQGSHKLNKFVFDNIDFLTSNFTIYHQTSKHSENEDHLISKELAKKYSNYIPFEFIFGEKYSEILTKSDFVFSRSGAHIVYELCYLRIPSIFVPIPWASQNEQYINAKNAAFYTPSVILNEENLNVVNFNEAIAKLKIQISSNKSYKQVEENSTKKMTEEILNL